MKRKTLLTEQEILDLARRAIDLLFPDKSEEDEDEDFSRAAQREWERRLLAGKAALRLCASSAALLGQPRLLPRLENWLEDLNLRQDDALSAREEVLEAVTSLLSDGAEVTATVRRLAKSRHADARCTVAGGLLPKTPAAIALLQTLAQDPHVRVRQLAAESVKKVRDVPWWYGKFDRDPLPRIDPARAEELKPVFEAIATWLDRPSWELRKDEQSLNELVEKLPDELAVELSARYLSQLGQRQTQAAMDLAVHMLGRAGGMQALWKAISSSSEHSFIEENWLTKLLLPLGRDLRVEASELLLATVRAATAADRNSMKGPVYLAAQVLAEVWPDDHDPTPVLDLYLAWPEPPQREADYIRGSLEKLLDRPTLDTQSIAERAIAALEDGLGSNWRRLSTMVFQIVEALPHERQRPIVELVLDQSGQPGNSESTERNYDRERKLCWALEQITGDLYDPARDGDRDSLIRRLLAEPVYRAAVFRSETLSLRALPWLRRDLATGELPAKEAAGVLHVIGQVHGGVEDVRGSALRTLAEARPPDKDLEKQQKARQILAPWSGEDDSGPVTEAEWNAYRRAQKELIEHDDDKVRMQALACFPEGPWRPEDRALFLHLVERWRAQPSAVVGLRLVEIVAARPAEEDLPLADEVIACVEKRWKGIPLLNLYANYAREKLGHDIVEDEASERAELEWMDEPEED